MMMKESLMNAVRAGVLVVGAGSDGCWLSAFVQSDAARKIDADIAEGNYTITDREFGSPTASVKCVVCGMMVCVGAWVRRYTLRLSRGRNAYIEMRRTQCPRCGGGVPVPPLAQTLEETN